jgi:hypothetical protein
LAWLSFNRDVEVCRAGVQHIILGSVYIRVV